MRNNALLASFHDQPAFVHQGMQAQFEACLAEAHATLTRIEANDNKPVMADDFWPSPDSWMAQYRPYVVRNGILHIPVKGVLIHGMAYAIGSWATGYVYLARALERGLADPDVKGIALIVDSGGGHVAGCFDLGDKIHACRKVKPIRAFAAEHAYSAAYLLACSASSITVARTGGVGSIGVVTVHMNVSKMMDQEGVEITFIHYGKHKVDGNPYEALPADVKERKQARINELGELFVSAVARNRAMDTKAIRDTEALTYTANEATSNGLADKIGSLDDAIAAFAADLSLNDEDETMSNLTDKSAVFEKARKQAYDEAYAESYAEGFKQGVTEERARYTAIVTSEQGKRRPQAAMSAANNTTMSAEAAIEFLAKLPEEQPASRAERAMRDSGFGPAKIIDFQSAMNASRHPEAGSTSGDAEPLSRAERAMRDSGFGLKVPTK